ncbi:Cytochrome P450 4g15 [Araneus ventricosus]|uniref:Cytochrome P450 4g15 n=1 Tax=Araneus ventricosus TaxID=182803 RepID=A0A4Y2ESC2_ARAVE|nr:Cytochrome P450 4g15 [Araneus ventricosus]
MPGTKPNFYNAFGDILEFDTSNDLQLQLLDVLKRLVELFRKQKLFCVWISYIPFVFLIKAEAVKEALKKHKMVDKSWQYSYFKVIFGDGIFASTGEKWKSRRKLLTSCFHPDILRSFLPIFNEKSQNLVIALRDETQKDFTEIIDFTTSCTVDIMSGT